MKYYDKIGKEIKVGSFVAYAVGSPSDTGIYFGVVEETRGATVKANGPMIRSCRSNRLMTRSGDGVLVIDEFKVQNAEYFI